MQEKNQIRRPFESFYHESQNLVCIITNETDDFGNRHEVHNLIPVERAFEVIKNLQKTINDYMKNN